MQGMNQTNALGLSVDGELELDILESSFKDQESSRTLLNTSGRSRASRTEPIPVQTASRKVRSFESHCKIGAPCHSHRSAISLYDPKDTW